MNLYVILLLLAIQGLVPSCCAGHSGEEVSGEEVSGEGPWEEEDLSGTNDLSTGGDDNFTGFDSGWSSADRGRTDPRMNPRTSRTYSNKRFVTSGFGEDKGGPQDDEGSQSKSNGSQDQGSDYENFESNMKLVNVGDAIDVMKKLKKAKSDQEFAKKLRSGPESLGVAFKTFEQLSGLWISVMHRIWRVWKAKGAKVVMHSIVHDLINNTGKAIKRKVGNMLSKNPVMGVSSSGWTTFKDKGSTEPDHSPATIHNQSGPLIERLSIDFRKNISKEAKASPSMKKERESVEKVKVSFSSAKLNDSKVLQQPSIQKQPKHVSGQGKNSSLAQETLAGSTKQNLTDKNEKRSRAIDASSMIMSKVKSTNSSTKRSENIPDTKGNLESSDNKKKDLKNSVGDAGKIGKTYLSHIEHEVTEHASGSDGKRNETKEKTNGDQIPNYNVSKGVTQSHSGVTHDVQEKANKQIPGEHAKQNTEQFSENDKSSSSNTESRNNSISSTLVNTFTHKRVSDKTNIASNKTGKTRVLETLKVNFLKENEISNWDQNNASNSEGNALETQRNVKLDNETNSKADSGDVGASSESTPAVGSDKKRASVLDKKNSNVQKPEVVTDGTNSQQIPKNDKEMPSNKGIDHNTSMRTRTTTSGKSEKIVVNLSAKEEKSKKNKTTTSVSDRKVDKDTQQKYQNGKTPESTQLAKTDVDSNSVSLESVTVQSNEQKVNSSSINTIHKRAGSTSSLTATNVQHDQKHLKQLQNGLIETSKNTTLDSPKANKTVPKENTQVTKKDIIPSEKDSESSQNHNASSEGDKRSHIENVRERNALDEISKQPVDKMTEKVNTRQDVDSLDNSRNDPPKKRLENEKILSTNTVERMNNSQGATSNGKRYKKVKEDAEFLNLQRHPAAGHDHFKKDQSNVEIRTLLDKNSAGTQTNIGTIERKDSSDNSSSVIQNSTSITVARSAENSQKAVRHPHQKFLKVSGKDQRISLSESINGHKENENPTIEKETKNDRDNGTTHTEGAINHGSERRMQHNSGSAVEHAPRIAPGRRLTDAQGRRLTNDLGSGEPHYPGSGVKHDPENGVTRDQGSDVGHDTKADQTHGTGSKATHIAKNESAELVINTKRVSNQLSNSPKQVPDIPHKQSTQLLITSESTIAKVNKANLKITKSSGTLLTNDVKKAHFKKARTQTNPKLVTQASRRTKEEERPSKGHHTTTQENSKNDDHKEPIKMQNSSPRTDPKPTDTTEEDMKTSKPQQVDVLTSRTPPTSLLTTSNDDNTYSIKQIVQGPKGSNFAYASDDDEKVRKLEKKVFKLESEVTVLETAMADLAKRLLVLEQKPEIPPTKATAILPHPSNEPKLRAQHPVHSQQQTTVYVTKDLGTPPQNPEPQYSPDKIVIPLSSLYSAGASSLSMPSSSQHVDVDRHETKVVNNPDGQDQKQPQDNTHVNLHQGTLPSPVSEAHAVVRPIVNIIVPNNKADLLSEGAICMPRCQNGGRCFDRNICRCPTFFTGDHCERFSLRDLLESPAPRERPYRKLQRVVVSEPPDQQVLDGTLNLDPGSPALQYRDFNQDLEPSKDYVAKQQPVEVASPSNGAEVDGAARRRQLILEI